MVPYVTKPNKHTCQPLWNQMQTKWLLIFTTFLQDCSWGRWSCGLLMGVMSFSAEPRTGPMADGRSERLISVDRRVVLESSDGTACSMVTACSMQKSLHQSGQYIGLFIFIHFYAGLSRNCIFGQLFLGPFFQSKEMRHSLTSVN